MESNKSSSLNRIFTRNMLHNFIDGNVDNVYSSVVRHYTIDADRKNNQELVSEIYCELKNNYCYIRVCRAVYCIIKYRKVMNS